MHLYLIGYRGSGKTSVGKLLGKSLSQRVVDSDDWIEQYASMTIKEIFAQYGEPHFRDLESKAIEEIASTDESLVVSLGGGAILRSENRERIAKTGQVVWLDASAQQLADRIAGDKSTIERRPALTKLAGYDEIVDVLAKRAPLYRGLANWVVMTDSKSIEQIAIEILQWFSSVLRIPNIDSETGAKP